MWKDAHLKKREVWYIRNKLEYPNNPNKDGGTHLKEKPARPRVYTKYGIYGTRYIVQETQQEKFNKRFHS